MTTHAHRAHDRHEPEGGACPTCGPTRTEQHPRREGVTRCANCKEWLTRPDSTPTEREARVRFPKSVGNATVALEDTTEREAGDVGEVAKVLIRHGLRPQYALTLAYALAPLIAERERAARTEAEANADAGWAEAIRQQQRVERALMLIGSWQGSTRRDGYDCAQELLAALVELAPENAQDAL